jgi:hypothetical protein
MVDVVPVVLVPVVLLIGAVVVVFVRVCARAKPASYSGMAVIKAAARSVVFNSMVSSA